MVGMNNAYCYSKIFFIPDGSEMVSIDFRNSEGVIAGFQFRCQWNYVIKEQLDFVERYDCGLFGSQNRPFLPKFPTGKCYVIIVADTIARKPLTRLSPSNGSCYAVVDVCNLTPRGGLRSGGCRICKNHNVLRRFRMTRLGGRF